MGFRTVVVLNNDQSHEWENDPELGKKIFLAASAKTFSGEHEAARKFFPYGQVVEQVHADTQTLAVFDGYSGQAVSHAHWYRGQTDQEKNLALLKALADQMGYRMIKKPTKESN